MKLNIGNMEKLSLMRVDEHGKCKSQEGANEWCMSLHRLTNMSLEDSEGVDPCQNELKKKKTRGDSTGGFKKHRKRRLRDRAIMLSRGSRRHRDHDGKRKIIMCGHSFLCSA